jgi:hypothetical protein
VAVNVYPDASVLVAMVVDDAFSDSADRFLRATSPELFISDFAAAEFSSVVARRVRSRDLAKSDAIAAFGTFDLLRARAAHIEATREDIARADEWIRGLDLPVRAPDAIHLAITQRLDLALATFDKHLVAAARKLHVKLAKL